MLSPIADGGKNAPFPGSHSAATRLGGQKVLFQLITARTRKDDQIVVIADGLEALTEGSASGHEDRDNLIRRAIHLARELRLPLIIASRPHDPLRGADATIMELEPLSQEAALEYFDPGRNSADARWLDWIVESADLAELPEYLQITRQLFRRGLLDYLPAERSARVDMRRMDRSELRVHLLATWMQALFLGYLMGAVPLNRSEREATVEWLSALACIGLLGDSNVVKYEDYYKGGPPKQLEMSPRPKYPEIDGKVQSFMDRKLAGDSLLAPTRRKRCGRPRRGTGLRIVGRPDDIICRESTQPGRVAPARQHPISDGKAGRPHQSQR